MDTKDIMIKTVSFNNVGTSGVNSDLAAIELPVESVTYVKNVNVDGNRLVSSPRHALWTTAPVTFNSGHLQPVSVASGKFWIVMGRSAAYVYDGTAWSDITSVAGYAGLGTDDELLWSSAMLGSIPVVNNIQHVPEFWSPQGVGQVLQPLEFSPGVTWLAAAKSFKIIRSHKTFLFALNLVEGGVEMPNSYRWSHPADNNGLPFTWDETDLSAIASIEQVLGDSGAIVDGLSLRDSFCIYSERGINILDFVGGEFVFQNRELSSTYGLITDKCITEVSGVHYFISSDDILRNDGNSVTSIMYNRIRKRFRALVNRDFFSRSFVILNTRNKEIYFCIPEGEAEYPNTAYAYNYAADTWTFFGLPADLAHGGFGSIADSSTPPLTWSTVTDTHNTTNLTYSSKSDVSPFRHDFVGLEASTDSLLFLNPATNTLNLDTESTIERTDIALEGNNKVTTITEVYPHMTGSSTVSIQFGSQEYTGGPVAWETAVMFNPSTDRKIDLLTTGSLHAYRMFSIGLGNIEFSGFTINYASSGER